MNGLDYLPKPYISKILIENGTNNGVKQPGYVDLYYEKSQYAQGPAAVPLQHEALKFTFNVALKSLYPVGDAAKAHCTNTPLIEATKVINTHVLRYKFITAESRLADFLLAENKYDYFMSLPGELHTQGQAPHLLTKDLSAYVSYDLDAPIISVPIKVQHLYKYSIVESPPSFLACVFCLMPPIPIFEPGPMPSMDNSAFTGEIIFSGDTIPVQTTYFIIGDTYSVKGNEYPINQNELVTSKFEKNPLTGLPIDEIVPSTDSEFVMLNYGKPSEIWCGPVHRHKVNGVYRYMGGASHGNDPHPYLNIEYKSNDKIVDNRIIGKLENMFVYDSQNFQAFLTQATETTFLGEDKKKAVDSYNDNPGIVSEVDYSLIKTKGIHGRQRGRVNLWFALDRLELLKTQSTFAPLLELFGALDSNAIFPFVAQVAPYNFNIYRRNVATGEKVLLLGSTNANYGDDSGKTDGYGNPIGKGHVFRKLVGLQVENSSPFVDYYEFRDGEVNTLDYDYNEYAYEIEFKFIDPFIPYLVSRLQALKKILLDLDEVIHKGSLKVISNSPLKAHSSFASIYGAHTTTYATNKMVDAYNRYTDKFDAAFLAKANNDPSFFTFNLIDNMPASLVSGFKLQGSNLSGDALLGGDPNGPESLATLLTMLNFDGSGNPEPLSSYDVPHSTISNVASFIRSSTRLDTATPSSLLRVTALLRGVEDKLVKLLSLFGLSHITKKSNFSYTDYLKGQGNFAAAKGTTGENAAVIHFHKAFQKTLNLYDMRNHFDWLDGKNFPQAAPNRNLKTVAAANYQQALSQNVTALLKPGSAKPTGGDSYMPYLGILSLDLANVKSELNATALDDFIKKSYQSMRKRVLTRHTDKNQNISIPEVLSFYGVKFEMATAADIERRMELGNDPLRGTAVDNLFWGDKSAYGPKHWSWWDSEAFDDNFGQKFIPVTPAGGGFNSSFGTDPSSVFTQDPFGSVYNPQYEWQGGPYEKYPLKVAKSLLSMIFSDNLQTYRDMDLFDVKSSPAYFGAISPNLPDQDFTAISTNLEMPAPLNLLALVASGLLGKEKLSTLFYDQLYDSKGNLRLDNYQAYIAYMSLFGRVRYLQGFEPAAGGGMAKTPSAFHYNAQVKSKLWAPITRGKLNSLGVGQMLYCKIELCRDNRLIDKKFTDLFSGYNNYNETFYIMKTAPGAVPAPPPVGITATIDTSLPSSGIETAPKFSPSPAIAGAIGNTKIADEPAWLPPAYDADKDHARGGRNFDPQGGGDTRKRP